MAAAKNTGFTIDCSHLFDGLFDSDDDAIKSVHESTMSSMEALREALNKSESHDEQIEFLNRMDKAAKEEREYLAQRSLEDKLFKGTIMLGAVGLVGYCFNAWVNRPQG